MEHCHDGHKHSVFSTKVHLIWVETAYAVTANHTNCFFISLTFIDCTPASTVYCVCNKDCLWICVLETIFTEMLVCWLDWKAQWAQIWARWNLTDPSTWLRSHIAQGFVAYIVHQTSCRLVSFDTNSSETTCATIEISIAIISYTVKLPLIALFSYPARHIVRHSNKPHLQQMIRLRYQGYAAWVFLAVIRPRKTVNADREEWPRSSFWFLWHFGLLTGLAEPEPTSTSDKKRDLYQGKRKSRTAW